EIAVQREVRKRTRPRFSSLSAGCPGIMLLTGSAEARMGKGEVSITAWGLFFALRKSAGANERSPQLSDIQTVHGCKDVDRWPIWGQANRVGSANEHQPLQVLN